MMLDGCMAKSAQTGKTKARVSRRTVKAKPKAKAKAANPKATPKSAPPAPVFPVAVVATFLNITPRRIQQLTKEGILPKAERGKYELLPVVRAYCIYLQGKLMGSDSMIPDMNFEKARMMKLKNEKLELELSEMKEELVPVSQVEKSWSEMVTSAKSALLSLPKKLAPRVAGEKDTVKCHDILKKNITQAMANIAKDGSK